MVSVNLCVCPCVCPCVSVYPCLILSLRTPTQSNEPVIYVQPVLTRFFRTNWKALISCAENKGIISIIFHFFCHICFTYLLYQLYFICITYLVNPMYAIYLIHVSYFFYKIYIIYLIWLKILTRLGIIMLF